MYWRLWTGMKPGLKYYGFNNGNETGVKIFWEKKPENLGMKTFLRFGSKLWNKWIGICKQNKMWKSNDLSVVAFWFKIDIILHHSLSFKIICNIWRTIVDSGGNLPFFMARRHGHINPILIRRGQIMPTKCFENVPLRAEKFINQWQV